MPTTATFYTDPTNLDYLIGELRVHYGDITGDVYSDTIMRTALISAVKYLQKRWASKYQIYSSTLLVSPQPSDVPAGYVQANTSDGAALIPSGLAEGSVFRNPFVVFTQGTPPILETDDEMALILAANYILRMMNLSSSSTSLSSWATEDIRFTNLSSANIKEKLVTAAKTELDDYFAKRIAKPQRANFQITYVPGLDNL